MASNELARLRADFLSIMESARGPRPISGGWYKAKKTPSGQHINGASHSIYRIHPHPSPFSVSNSSRSSLGGSETELKMSQTHTISWLTTEEGGGVVQALHPSQRWLRATRATTINVSKLLTSWHQRACVCVQSSIWPSTPRFSDFWFYNTGDNKFSRPRVLTKQRSLARYLRLIFYFFYLFSWNL